MGWLFGWEARAIDVDVELEAFSRGTLARYGGGFHKVVCLVYVLVASPIAEPINYWGLKACLFMFSAHSFFSACFQCFNII